MEIFGHVVTMRAAFRRAHVSETISDVLVREHAAKLCLTDAIRWTVRGDDVVKFGRGYSHYTDGCYMVLPFGEKLKTFTDIHQTEFYTNEFYRNKFADEPTDFAKFIRINAPMFSVTNEAWGLCALVHLQQDVASDSVWQHNLCRCDTANDQVVYVKTGKVVDGKTFREDMALANVYMHNYFVEAALGEFEDVINDATLEEARQSFAKYYYQGMADNTGRYLEMDPRVFGMSYDQRQELVAELIEKGLVNSEEELLTETITLYETAIACCNPIVNLFVR